MPDINEEKKISTKMIRKIDKSDFEKFKSLRKKGLKFYKDITNDEIDISSERIENEFEDILSNDKRILFVDNKLKGYIIGSYIENSYEKITYIDDIYVDKNSRSKGIGKDLIKKFEKWSKSKDANIIRLAVSKNNKKAIRFYKELKFKIKHHEMEKMQHEI
ncbi:MAG: GNAT family N-acetyltransferase [Candidatus Woesearchaeota archaeon]